jgi:hypothetical protein
METYFQRPCRDSNHTSCNPYRLWHNSVPKEDLLLQKTTIRRHSQFQTDVYNFRKFRSCSSFNWSSSTYKASGWLMKKDICLLYAYNFLMIILYLTPGGTVLLKKLIFSEVVKNICTFYRTGMLIAILITACNCSLSWATWVHILFS